MCPELKTKNEKLSTKSKKTIENKKAGKQTPTFRGFHRAEGG
jgi:hypothetical protein